MLTKNFKTMMALSLQAYAANGKGFFPVVAVNNVTYYANANFSGVFPASATTGLTLSEGAAGVCIGSGATPATENDHNLEAPFTSGLATAMTVNRGASRHGTSHVDYTITVINTGTVPITIREIGYRQTINAAENKLGTGVAARVILVDRTVLDSPVSLAPGEAGVVYYQLATLKDAAKLRRITVTSNPSKTSYGLGQKLSLTGIEVTAEYLDGTSYDVTKDCIFSPGSGSVLLQAGNKTIDVSYTEGNVTETTSFNVTVASSVIPDTPSATSATGAYGVEWDYSVGATPLTRLGLATDFGAPQPATSVSETGSSPFDNILPWSGMKRYNVIDGAIAYSEDDPEFDEENYDTVVYIPEFYYTAHKDTLTQRWMWAVSATQLSGYVKHPGSGRYVGRFYTSGNYNEQHSKSGLAPLVNTPRYYYRDVAREKGAHWYMIDAATWSAIQLLYLIEYANFNSQAMLGSGTGGSAVTGQTHNAVYHSLKRNDYNMYRWIERPFGYLWCWLDGYMSCDYKAFIGLDDFTFTDTTYQLDDAGVTVPGGASRSFITSLGYSPNYPWAFLPDAVGGSDSTYTTDAMWSAAGMTALIVGGNDGAGSSAGFFAFAVDHPASAVLAYIGSRLLFIP